ncbi:MAG TPA: hypothetical protein VFR68_09780 [Candidatus Dormibacteraeota bacterium]|nr:hypothetical protein [Candidatus Dormibacteraeota bacterium]
MAVPDRVFLIVVETEGERDPDQMNILNQLRGSTRSAPVFSSMQLATTFLARAQELGYFVKLDYVFPADPRRLREDFPDHEFRLDPSPEAFFETPTTP